MSEGSNGSGLKFELQLSVQKALKDVDRFTQQAKKRIDKVRFNPVSDGRGGGKDNSSTRVKVAKDELARIERLEVLHHKNLKAIRDEARQDYETLLKQGTSIAESEFKRQSAMIKEHTNVKVRTLNEAERVLEQSNRKIVDEAKRTSEKQASEQQRVVERARAAGQQRVELARNEYNRIKILGVQYGQEAAQTQQWLTNRLKQLLKQGTQITEAEYRRRLQVVRQMAKQMAIAELTQQSNGKGGKDAARSAQRLFQVQQAIEDFSYAGMRGATNNIAALAAMIGGPAGLLAMLGVLGITLPPIIKTTMDWMNGNKEAAEALKEHAHKARELRDAQRQLYERGAAGGGPKNHNEVQGRIQEIKSLIDIQEREKRKVEEKIRLYEEAEQVLREYAHLSRSLGPVSAIEAMVSPEMQKELSKSGQQALKEMGKLAEVIEDVERRGQKALGSGFRLDPQDYAWLHQGAGNLTEGQQDEYDKFKSEAADRSSSANRYRQELQYLKERRRILNDLSPAQENMARKVELTHEKLSKEALSVSEVASRYRELAGAKDKAYEEKSEKAKELAQSQINSLRNDLNATSDAGEMQQIELQIIQVYRNLGVELAGIKNKHADITRQIHFRADSAGRIVHAATEELKILDQLSQKNDQLIEQTRQRIEQLKQSTTQFKSSHGQSMFGIDKHLATTSVNNSFEKKKTWAESNAESYIKQMQKAQEYYQKMSGIAKGPMSQMFSSQAEKASKAIQNAKQMLQKYIEKLKEAQKLSEEKALIKVEDNRQSDLAKQSSEYEKTGMYDEAVGAKQEQYQIAVQQAMRQDSEAKINLYKQEANRIQQELLQLVERERAKQEEKLQAQRQQKAEIDKMKQQLESVVDLAGNFDLENGNTEKLKGMHKQLENVRFELEKINKMQTDMGMKGSGSALGGLGGSVGALGKLLGIPGYASGGLMQAGRMAVVGEKGPEMIIPKEDSYVLNNESVKALSGNADLRGRSESRRASGPDAYTTTTADNRNMFHIDSMSLVSNDNQSLDDLMDVMSRGTFESFLRLGSG
ncbi:hypothetical protein [Calycomorphotria hydatis]|uniref:Uncharacterized protein n=1 Tax=Calycomorphotria hydatis TaxID=2528027 RepID=A0A517TB77_9PLAN|nr:hypothetical protein [Calycomorphotria hydatis]QDT65627.1 hypothetical protein V22_28850 [Calycomorphotria hydatis]